MAKDIVKCIKMFALKVKNSKLKLSPKAKIVTTSQKCSKLIQQECAGKGIYFKVDKCARDLGVQFSISLAGSRKILNNRYAMAKNRIHKISQLAKISKKAKNLFKGSAMPAATWGHSASGITPTQRIQLERDALTCAGM